MGTQLESAQRYLLERGVLEDTAQRFQVELVREPSHDQLICWLGNNSYILEAALVFPNLVPDQDTASIKVHNYSIRCFPPPVWSDGKERKFLCTLGSAYRPYILPPVLDAAYDTSIPIYIVEKQAAALLLWQNGLCAIALEGTWGSGAKREEGERVQLHPVLAEFDWTGRPVYLCFDSDFRARESVLQGLVRTYILFSIAGAVVRVLQWQPQCKGLDDFIAAKAGVDLEKQRVELDTLTATVSNQPAAKAAETWIIPQYRCLFEREIMAISPHTDQRSMLADQIFKALGTTAGDLKRGWRETTKPPMEGGKVEVVVEDIEPWPEPVTPAEIGQLLLTRWHTHLVTSDVNYWALSLWPILTHLKDRLSLLPQLGICSALKRCGKTRTLEVLERIVWKGLLAASVSPAATFRTIEKYEPCFLIDEFDAFLKENEEFRGILNTCHSRGVVHIRCHPETHEPQAFNAFCAVAIALIGELPSTVEDRAILIYLERKQSSQLVLPVRKVPPEVFMEEGRKIRRFALDYGTDILRAIPVLPKLSNDRALENWEPLAQIAQVLGGDWPYRAFLCAKTLTPSDSDDQSFTIQLLVSLRGLFKTRGLNQPGREEEVLPTNIITAELNKDTEAPWADRKKYFAGLTTEKLSFELRRFKIVRSRRDNTQSGRPRGYCWKDLRPIFIANLGGDDDGAPPPPSPDSPPPPPPPPPPNPPPQESPKTSDSEKMPESVDGLGHLGTESVRPSQSTSSECPSPVETHAIILRPGQRITHSGSTTSKYWCPDAQVGLGDLRVFCDFIPPSTPNADFCTPSTPDNLVCLDVETFYPYSADYPQPESPPGTLLRRQNRGLAHPWAKDPRRCALRFLTVYSPGQEPMTVDLSASPIPHEVKETLASCTLVGHNLDFDLTVLRRYGVPVSSSIIDTMTASRLLGLGKEKFKVPTEIDLAAEYDDLDDEADSNPIDHSLATVVKRYLGIKMDKAQTKLGGSDWGRSELSDAHYHYH